MTSRKVLPALLLLFIGSGCAALIYEIVWFQLLQLVVGSSAISLGVLLGTFMGGMCLGSLALSFFVPARQHPLRVYACLELGIGLIGLLALAGMPLISNVYTSWAGPGVAGVMLRAVIAGICLLPPTLLMGATLPAISRWVEATPEGVAWLGFFYGGNIGGAVVGSVLAGFYLLRVYDVSITTYVAVAINVAVALGGLGIAAVTTYKPVDSMEMDPGVRRASGAAAVYVVIALSGLTALAAEVVWTRLLSLLFGATTYTFSLILAVFLFGLGIGSTIGSAMAARVTRPRAALGWCQVGLCVCMAWTAYVVSRSLPYWPINPSAVTNPWINFQIDSVRALFAVLPAAILWGASFPLALAAVAARGQDPAKLVGGVYAANTVGAIVGSLGASLVFVAWIGTQHTQQVLMVVAAAAGGILLLAPATDEAEKSWWPTLAACAAIIVGAFLVRNVQRIPDVMVAYGRYANMRVNDEAQYIYVGEGMTADVAVSRLSDGVLNYHNAGKVQASSEPQDMRLQRMLGHMTTLIPPSAKRVVVIGCGAGVTAGAVSVDPVVTNETIAEIEPLVPKVVSTYFGDHNFNVVKNPKVHVRIDDARHYILTSREKFDAVTSDPLDPWVKGAAMLYTREFFEAVKQHLNPGGVVTLFVQLYESNTEAVKSEIGTFFEAFPNGVIWGNTNNGQGYDLVLLGQVGDGPIHINVDAIQQRLQRPEYATVRKSLNDIGFYSATDLFSSYAGRAQDLKDWLKDAPINRDRNLRLQYLAGLGLNLYESGPIYSEILRYRKFPQDLFVGQPATIDALRAGIQRGLDFRE
ncbi:MAG TPA: fused MFS/spermidine synthase [Vicinamibacterales bacterium]|nr:fused MFS/spermidine synthase [Vicinamibacterales bacterium]